MGKILLLGNIISFAGAIVMVCTGLLKSKKNILIAQCFQYGIMGAGNIILGGITGGIANFISILRNLITIKFNFTTPLKIIFIVLQVIFTAFMNTQGIIGWLPTVAACIFTWCLDTKSEILIKLLIIIAQLMWSIYDISIKNFASLTFDILTIITNIIGIVMIKSKKPETAASDSSKETITE
ncbi:MAG: YgjV family protein [Treponema sp.]|nr:YgjV family protein [Treponema sp.]